MPPPGEQGGPHDRFGGEEANDDEQHVIGEAADEVQARRMRFWLEPPPLVGCLAVHLNRRYRTRADKAACGLVDRSNKQYTELYADTVSV